MKIYSKLVAKIRNNKNRIKKAGGIGIMALRIRYGSINSIPTNLSSNSTQQIEKVQNFVEQDMQVVNTDGKVIQTGSGVLISNKRISEGSKSALGIRSGDSSKTGPGARAKTDARRNAKAGKYSSGSTIVTGVDAFRPQNTYRHYQQTAPLSCKLKVRLAEIHFKVMEIITSHLLKMVILM